ncbi:hypothetical protein OVY01_11820 [Robbsia sp. Bb-Pol-6]|uniref:Uncharacterized protein n=1 Tax=Robbsia betulipollinis TaxID=2981849 RepID=A0ABT3ZN10_9BURK|nr:hypothetical protein [Robbsia betulipollinis]MCY0387910.1 hypothetical protein [Robbsia betulipollinis]
MNLMFWTQPKEDIDPPTDYESPSLIDLKDELRNEWYSAPEKRTHELRVLRRLLRHPPNARLRLQVFVTLDEEHRLVRTDRARLERSRAFFRALPAEMFEPCPRPASWRPPTFRERFMDTLPYILLWGGGFLFFMTLVIYVNPNP